MLFSTLSLLMPFLYILAYCAVLHLCVHVYVLCNCLLVLVHMPTGLVHMLIGWFICLLVGSYAHWLVHMFMKLVVGLG
jgi:hypothetical protein